MTHFPSKYIFERGRGEWAASVWVRPIHSKRPSDKRSSKYPPFSDVRSPRGFKRQRDHLRRTVIVNTITGFGYLATNYRVSGVLFTDALRDDQHGVG